MVLSQLRGFARAIADRGFWSAGGRGAARWLPGGVFRHPAFPGAGRRPLSILFARARSGREFCDSCPARQGGPPARTCFPAPAFRAMYCRRIHDALSRSGRRCLSFAGGSGPWRAVDAQGLIMKRGVKTRSRLKPSNVKTLSFVAFQLSIMRCAGAELYLWQWQEKQNPTS